MNKPIKENIYIMDLVVPIIAMTMKIVVESIVYDGKTINEIIKLK